MAIDLEISKGVLKLQLLLDLLFLLHQGKRKKKKIESDSR